MYEQRLKWFNELSLSHSRLIANTVLVFKCLHNQMTMKPDGIGLILTNKNERSDKINPIQLQHNSRQNHVLFKYRVPSFWNELPVHIMAAKSVSQFKIFIHRYILSVLNKDFL